MIGLLAWVAAGPNKVADSFPTAVPRALRTAPAPAPADRNAAPRFDSEPRREPAVPADVIAPIATVTEPAALTIGAVPVMRDPDAPRPMIVPVAGVDRSAMRDTFNDGRGNRRHEASTSWRRAAQQSSPRTTGS